MESFATIVLIFFGIIVFLNYTRGSLRSWLKAKFLNSASPDQSNAFASAS